MTPKELFFHNMLIDLHTFRWTMNSVAVKAILDNIGAYSYAHTNSNFYDEDDKEEKAYERLVEVHNQIMAGGYLKTEKEYDVPKELISKWLKKQEDGK
jgi:hypothetical protein